MKKYYSVLLLILFIAGCGGGGGTSGGGTPAGSSFTVTFTNGANGTISGSAGYASQTVVSGASTAIPVTAIPSSGYHFLNWSNAAGSVIGTLSTLTVTGVTASEAITANFQIDSAANGYGVTFAAGANGSLSGNPGYATQTVANGASTAIPVTAIPVTGYHFLNWTDAAGTVIGTDNPLTVTNVTIAKTITANFQQDSAANGFAVTFLSTAGGTITGTISQNVANNGNATPVTAVAIIGYHFVNWTDGNVSVGTANTLTLTGVTAARTITANFAAEPYISTVTATDPVTGMVASFTPLTSVQDVSVVNGHRLFQTIEIFEITVNVANIPTGVNYEVHVVATDAQGNTIPQFADPTTPSIVTDFATFKGNSPTKTINTYVNAGTPGAGNIAHWTITSISAVP